MERNQIRKFQRVTEDEDREDTGISYVYNTIVEYFDICDR